MYEVRCITTPSLKVNKPKLRGVKSLAHCYKQGLGDHDTD